ncbi:MAG: F0F1 ATP synthase subunit delta [Methylohalobius crimeensis]
MSELKTLARPYAEAVFEQAREAGTIEQWSRMLEFLTLAMKDEELAWAAVNPKVEKEAFERLLLDIGKGYLDREGENFVKLLVHNNRIALVDPIRDLFEQYRTEHEGYAEVQVVSAYPLAEEDRAALTAALEKKLGKKIRLDARHNQALIGGIVIQAGDKVIDGSVKGQLERLAKRLKA